MHVIDCANHTQVMDTASFRPSYRHNVTHGRRNTTEHCSGVDIRGTKECPVSQSDCEAMIGGIGGEERS